MTRARSVWLAYHEVEVGEPAAGVPRTAARYHVPHARFTRQLDALRAAGRPILTAAESVAGTGDAATDHLVLTFDDGWAGALTLGVEALVEAGVRATFFVTQDHIGTRRFASREQLVEARQAGMELGTHGRSHRLLGELDAVTVAAELRESKAFLEDLLGDPVTSGSAPGGSWSSAVGLAARELGYACFCTSRAGVNRVGNDPFQVRRLAVYRDTGVETVARWGRFSVADVLARQALLGVPRRLLGARRYALLRRRLLGTSAADDILVLD